MFVDKIQRALAIIAGQVPRLPPFWPTRLNAPSSTSTGPPRSRGVKDCV